MKRTGSWAYRFDRRLAAQLLNDRPATLAHGQKSSRVPEEQRLMAGSVAWRLQGGGFAQSLAGTSVVVLRLRAMTNHSVLIGSLLAVNALWATAYAALLPEPQPASTSTTTPTATEGTEGIAGRRPAASPSRWSDLPSDELPRATSALPSAANATRPSQPLTKTQPEQTDSRRLRRLRRSLGPAASVPPLLTEPHYGRGKASSARLTTARRKWRRSREQVKFSLASRG